MKKILIPLLLVGLVAVNLAYTADVRSQGPTVKAREAVILYLQGDVKVQAERSIKWTEAAVGMILKKGDSIKTGPRSWAELRIEADYTNVFRMREKTLIKLAYLWPAEISLLKGEIRSLVEGLSKGSTFQIETPLAVCGVRGTGWDTQTDGKKDAVYTYEEEVHFSPKGQAEEEIIEEGKRGILKDPKRPVAIGRVSFSRIRSWEKWIESLIERGIITRSKEEMQNKFKKLRDKQKALEDRMKGKLERRDRDAIIKRTPSVHDGS
jgi:hypothetical protein